MVIYLFFTSVFLLINVFIQSIYFVCLGALQITESDKEDQGKYECVANNSVGTEYSKSTTLYVKGGNMKTIIIFYLEKYQIIEFSNFLPS